MKLEQYSVGSYFREASEKRLEIIYDNYDNFPNVIIGFKKNLKLLIVSEKAAIRNRMRDELGTRIQNSGNYSPTEANAITNMMIEQAIASGDFSDSMFKDLTIMQEVYDGYTEISVMKAEYEAFVSAFDSMVEAEKAIMIPYLNRSQSRDDIANNLGVTTEAVNQRIKRIKRGLKKKVIRSMRVYA